MKPLARALAAGSLLTLALQPAAAQVAPVLPSGATVMAGQAQISTSGRQMTVVNTPQTILNWNSFSIGAGNAVYFQQQSAASAVLNRVTGNDASAILGSLGSNGRVWLLNPNGVLFGANARVDVASLVAGTLRLNDGDWLAGRYGFTSAGGGAAVLNQGELRSSFGGSIALLGDSVANEGLIQAPGGQIVLAAGRSIELVDTGAPNLGVRISAAAGEARNLGTLQAAGGRIDIHAAAVNQSGIVSADGFANGPGGEVWIKAAGAIDLGAASRTSADGASGGTVHVESDTARTTLLGSVSARGAEGQGGEVALLGREVGLLGAATVDVSGALGGGSVHVGGGLRGQDARYANAEALYFGPQASVVADATWQGDGGRIVLWSNAATRAFGTLSVRGGAQGGDGGFIETSGGWLDARPMRVDTAAPHGRSGSWLLDPFDLTISDEVTNQGVSPDFTATRNDASVASRAIVDALNAGTNVTVSTGGASSSTGTGSQSGTITVSGATLVASTAAPGSLTLLADGDINVYASTLGSSAGPMTIQLLAGRGAAGAGSGAISIDSSVIDVSGDGSAAGAGTARRNISIGGFATGSGPVGSSYSGAAAGAVSITGSILDATGGTLSIGAASGGVALTGNSIAADRVLVQGATASGIGVLVDGSTTIAATDSITVQGRSQSGAGLLVTDAALISLAPLANTGSHLMLLRGEGSGAPDVAILPTAFSTPDRGRGTDAPATPAAASGAPIVATNGANITIDGAALVQLVSSDVPAIDASAGGGNVLIGSGVVFVSAPVLGSSSGSSLLRFTGTQVAFNEAAVSTGGAIQVAAPSISIDAGSSLSASASGDAIVLSGAGNGALTGFVNAAGAAALSTSGSGRYIVYADSAAALVGTDAGLAVDFKRVGAAYGAWAGDSGNGLVFAAASKASATVVIADRVYDRSLNAPIASATIAAENGDRGALVPGATARYADASAGSGKSASLVGTATPFVFTDADGTPIYGYAVSTNPLAGTVTPRSVTASGLAVGDKVYDGNTTASFTGSPGVTPLAGDTLFLQGTPTASFADRNVGTGKTVTLAGLLLGGADAANYTLAPLGMQTASITPATLQYVATPAIRVVGLVPTDLTGSVSGFVGGDTLGNATQGTAAFTAQVSPASPAGSYAVLGSGLAAPNYRFTQAPANAQALTLANPAPQTAELTASSVASLQNVVPFSTVLPSLDLRPGIAGINDQTVTAPPRNVAPVGDFGAVPLASLSADQLANLLAGRRAFMDRLLADSVQRLTLEPAAADLRDCEVLEQAQLDQARLGNCLVTAKFKASLAAPEQGGPESAPAPAPVPAPAPAIAAVPTAPAAPTEPPVAQAKPPLAQASLLRLAAIRPVVRSAALPQIERKIALLIGVDRYQDPSIPTLGNAVADARAVAEVFEKRLGYETVVLDNATKPALVAALNQLALALRPRDSVIVYYAGHGELVATTQLGYWLLADSVAKQPETWLSNTDINRLIAQMGASQVALVSDSCYSGSLASEERIRALAAAPDPNAVLDRRSVVVMSSGGNEPVADEGRDGHSPFAWNLMNTLNQLNRWQAGGNVFERVRFAVARTLPQRPQYTASRNAGHQAGGDYLFEQRVLVPGR